MIPTLHERRRIAVTLPQVLVVLLAICGPVSGLTWLAARSHYMHWMNERGFTGKALVWLEDAGYAALTQPDSADAQVHYLQALSAMGWKLEAEAYADRLVLRFPSDRRFLHYRADAGYWLLLGTDNVSRRDQAPALVVENAVRSLRNGHPSAVAASLRHALRDAGLGGWWRSEGLRALHGLEKGSARSMDERGPVRVIGPP